MIESVEMGKGRKGRVVVGDFFSFFFSSKTNENCYTGMKCVRARMQKMSAKKTYRHFSPRDDMRIDFKETEERRREETKEKTSGQFFQTESSFWRGRNESRK